jgi:CRP-like cAMP-binding protein
MEEIITALLALSDKTLVLERNGYLSEKGKVETDLYYVESGSLKAFVYDKEEQIIRFGYTGNLITSIDSFLSKRPSEVFVQAIKKTVLRVIPRNKVDHFMRENMDFWVKTLEDLVVQQLEREVDILTVSPRERYERVLARSPQLFQEIPHKYIANYLRMKPETLSRLIKKS